MQCYLEAVWRTLNSNFTTALVGSLAGAFAGAYAAQKIAVRAKLRDDVSRDLASLNAAISLASSIASTAFNLKSQHVGPMLSSYLTEKHRFEEWISKRKTGAIQGNTKYDLRIDLRTMPTANTPTAALSGLVYGQVQIVGRPLNLCAALVSAVDNLNAAIQQRARYIEMFKAGALPDGAGVTELYLGLPYGQGHVNQEFGDNLSAIHSYVDDVIFFSTQLCADLTSSGEELRSKHKRILKPSSVSVIRTDFSEQQAGGLMPNLESYQSWFAGFKKAK